ncbi:hypothetical protein [Acetobacter persici]|uniref:Uncharacterized protein n=1 Tax=Acetobacter persici TaxID=1076596 RepID=A0A1U9LJQ2_9PROT|nr:hypothetical protein [Acetobacter persici]AQT06651.1 hypothetical protein A0U91_16735 [Acetobacter persici]
MPTLINDETGRSDDLDDAIFFRATSDDGRITVRNRNEEVMVDSRLVFRGNWAFTNEPIPEKDWEVCKSLMNLVFDAVKSSQDLREKRQKERRIEKDEEYMLRMSGIERVRGGAYDPFGDGCEP